MTLRNHEIYEALRRDDIAYLICTRYESVLEYLIGPDVPPMLRYSHTPLMTAAYFGSYKCFSFLWKKGNTDYIVEETRQHAIHFAAAGGNLQIFKFFESQGKLMDARDINGETPLMIACKFGRASIVQYLCTQGVNIMKQSRETFTAGHFAASVGSVPCLEILHGAGDNFMSMNLVNWTPLHYALKYRHLDVIEYLVCINAIMASGEGVEDLMHLAATVNVPSVVQAILEMGETESRTNHNKWNFLMFAASNGHAEVMEAIHPIISRKLFHTKDRYERNLLHIAAIAGHLNVLQFLEDFELAYYKDRFGKTPLHYAAEFGHPRIIAYLLARDDVNVRDKLENTPLHAAAMSGCLRCVEELFKREEINVNVTNNMGETPLMLSVVHGHDSITGYLLEKGADQNIPDNAGKTPLIQAVCCGSDSAIGILCDLESTEVFKADNEGWTPIHYAAQIGDVANFVFFEIKDSQSLTIQNNKGRTPLDIAIMWKQINIVELAVNSELTNEPNFNVRDEDGNVAIHHAVKRADVDITRALMHHSSVSLNVQNNHGQTPLHIAIETWQIDVMHEFVLSGKCDMSIKDSNGRTPFLLAVSLGQLSTVSFLLTNDKHLDTAVADKRGNTALHIAAGLLSPNVLQMLYAAERFDFSIENKAHMTPLDVAASKNGKCLIFLASKLGVEVQTEEEEAFHSFSGKDEEEEEEEAHSDFELLENEHNQASAEEEAYSDFEALEKEVNEKNDCEQSDDYLTSHEFYLASKKKCWSSDDMHNLSGEGDSNC